MGTPQRGIIHSAFDAAANIAFPNGFVLSLNAASSSHLTTLQMPNGLQLTATPGTFPFTALRAGMPVLFGAQRLHIEAIGCSLDLSLCSQWNPHIERPAVVDMEIARKNRELLGKYVNGCEQGEGCWQGDRKGRPYHTPDRHTQPYIVGAGLVPALPIAPVKDASNHLTNRFPCFPHIRDMAEFLCGRGIGLTPSGDDMLAGWMAAGWLLYGPLPNFRAACKQIVEVAKRQTHLLSQCWLGYAAEGNFAQPVCALLEALIRDDERQLSRATESVLAMGATSGHDLIQGMLLMLNEV